MSTPALVGVAGGLDDAPPLILFSENRPAFCVFI